MTGAHGYVGGRLLAELSHDADVAVRAVDRHPVSAVRAREHIVCDLAADRDAARMACDGIDTVVHLAGVRDTAMKADQAAGLTDTIVATAHLAEAAASSSVERVVYLSTVHVYGDRIVEGALITEDLRPEPRGSYGISRLACEHLLAGRGRDFDLVIFRLTNSVGAPHHPDVNCWSLVVNDLCRQGALTDRLELHTAGVQWRDFIPLADVCRIIATSASTESPTPGSYNLASGQPRTVREMAHLVQDAFERCGAGRPKLVAPPLPPSRPAPYTVSTHKLDAEGSSASVDIETAIEETVRFCLEHRGAW